MFFPVEVVLVDFLLPAIFPPDGSPRATATGINRTYQPDNDPEIPVEALDTHDELVEIPLVDDLISSTSFADKSNSFRQTLCPLGFVPGYQLLSPFGVYLP